MTRRHIPEARNPHETGSWPVALDVHIALKQVIDCSHTHVYSNNYIYKVKFTLEQATKAQRGRSGIALHLL